MTAQSAPIGIFDSGVGGLSIAAAVHTILPRESLIYYADRAYFPYGDRSEEEVRKLALDAAGFLIEKGAKLVVGACNTASSVALQDLRETYDVPFVGVVPGVKAGSATSAAAKVGVLATEATFQTQAFAELVSEFASGVEIISQQCPDLVSLVEQGQVGTAPVRALLRRYIEPLQEQGVDTIVLGCTHYGFLEDDIRYVAGPDVAVINTAMPVAQQVARVLESHDLLNPGPGQVGIAFYASADLEGFLTVVDALWPAARMLPR